MGKVFSKLKDALTMPEEDVYGNVEGADIEEEDYVQPKFGRRQRAPKEPAYNDNIVDFNSSPASKYTQEEEVKPHLAFEKIDSFDEVISVAEILKSKRILILNLETCPLEDSRRVVDFLSGVAFANNGEIKRVAGKAYVITPDDVPISGDLLDEATVNAAKQNNFFNY